MESEQVVFTPADLDLLVKVIRLIPNLEMVLYAARAVRANLSYPIANHQALIPLFEAENQVFEVGQHRIAFHEAQRFLPAEFFPITSEDDLLTKVYITLCNGYVAHSRIKRPPLQYILETMRLPEGMGFIHPEIPVSPDELDRHVAEVEQANVQAR
jgi:hypothetical protein